MSAFLNANHFPSASSEEGRTLEDKLEKLLERDYLGNFYALLGGYQRILADNIRRDEWPAIHDKLQTLFMCGKAAPLDGPMIGIPVSIRDSDYFVETARIFGHERSIAASIEWMATAWNATFADTGLWMGKTYEPVSADAVARLTGNDAEMAAAFDAATTRVGRNFFREPPDPNIIQSIGLPGLTPLWRLHDRPKSVDEALYEGQLLSKNLEKEKAIPYSKTGGIFLANMGKSVVPEMKGKAVYQLNYRWPKLNPAYPMTRLIDEVVQIDDGIYLGQLVFATRHYSLGGVNLPFLPGAPALQLGEAYCPHPAFAPDSAPAEIDYKYQNNGFFLMMDPAYAKQVYGDAAFPQLRPRAGEQGYVELGYDKIGAVSKTQGGGQQMDWIHGWKNDTALREKFTTFLLEPSTRESDGDVRELLRDGESILQMLQRISRDISAQSAYDDHLRHFETLHRLFRAGVAPQVSNGLFQGHGKNGYNIRVDGQEQRDWYGEPETAEGFDYYHGATLNLHWGFADTFCPDRGGKIDEGQLYPSALATMLRLGQTRGPNILNALWASIGKYIFPWAGKSFEKVSGRKLSMLLDESDDLAERYPDRVHELHTHLASAPHYDLVLKNQNHYWSVGGLYAQHLKSGSWDKGMTDEDKAFWSQEAEGRWVFGNNIQDARILAADPLMRLLDMNYRTPDASLQAVSEAGPSPFARQGYIFLGVAGQQSIMPMNNGETTKKKVFQFHYRYPMIGGAAPIGLCLDELVEIADGLFLGQLIYATALDIPFHSSVDSASYKYQLFGYFLLLDDQWEYHRKAIGLDVV
jgi:hypothetical protein